LLMLFKSPLEYTLFGLIMSLIVIWRHKENIKRLIKGTENKIKFKEK
jgi:glycerol-3-phosphate acyltransferase PlsY